MITHLPIFAHPNPKKVLIIGGGDGGVLREVAKHKGVETIHMCEIDEQVYVIYVQIILLMIYSYQPKVVEMGRRFFPTTLATSFSDPRLTLLFDDAARYLREEGSKQGYDIIICDSSDPVGPAEVLFQPQFFSSMANALAPGGIVCTQGECQWLHLDLIASVIKECRGIFAQANYAYTAIPTYPSGQIGFIIGTKSANVDLTSK